MSYDVLNKMLNDKDYTNLQTELEKLKNTIYDNAISSENKIPHIKNAIEIANKMYLRSIEKRYSKSCIEIFGNDPDELVLNDLKDSLEFYIIRSKYKKALECEEKGDYNKALEIHYDILKSHVPIGSSYYSTPILLLERTNSFQEAIKICDLAINNIKKYNLNFEASNFENWKNKLAYEIKISEELIPYIKNNPGILQKNVYKNFDLKYKYLIQQILYDMDKDNRIIRRKHGTSYELYVK